MWFIPDTSVIERLNGRLGDIVFYTRFNRLCGRRYVVPRNPDTPMQRANRQRFALAVHAWQLMPMPEKNMWNEFAKKSGARGYNLFLKSFMKGDVRSEVLPEGSACATGEISNVVALKPLCIRFHSVSPPMFRRSWLYARPIRAKSPPGQGQRIRGAPAAA